MVHLWISLCNDKIETPCLNKRILRIFRNDDAFFYGDYEFDMYIGTKHDYSSLEDVVSKVITKCGGWIRYMKVEDGKPCEKSHMSSYISQCGSMSDSAFRKMFPWKENYKVVKGVELRNDGNFKMFACETDRYYYVICFATS